MKLSTIIEQYYDALVKRFGTQINDDQRRALYAIQGCRTEQYGTMTFTCQHCQWQTTLHHSCGHRACPQCQNHDTTLWLNRQMKKQLPVEYFMVTFTLPKQLRDIAQQHSRIVFGLMMQCASATLQLFARNDRHLQDRLGMTAVLHTHSRRLDFHPHVHVLLPGGAINKKHRIWRTSKGKYLFNHRALAKVFRGLLLKNLRDAGLLSSTSAPLKWIVDCQYMGSGAPALKYLSQYLYRGVISEKNIVRDDGEYVTFKFKDSKTRKMKSRTVKGEVFLWLILQHVLPKGFRRSRDYGFLHGNAKGMLAIVQWILKVDVTEALYCVAPPRPMPACRLCGGYLHITFDRFNHASSG